MNTNHIVFFTQLYYPDMTTTAIIMTDLAEDLAAYGLDAKVVCAQPTYIKNLGIGEVRDLGIVELWNLGIQGLKDSGIEGFRDCGKSPRIECHHGVLIKRVWSFLFDKNNIVGRILNSTSCFVSMLLTVFSFSKNHLLIFNTNPALLPLLGFMGARLRGQKYVVLVHDLWPELPAHVGMIRKGGILYRAIDFVTKLSFKYASATVVLSGAMKKRVFDKVPEMDGSVHVIHNWVDANRVYPVAKANNRLIKELGLQDKKVVMYSGNLGRYQPLEVMIHAAGELRDRDNIVFVFAGDGGKRQKIQEMAASRNLDNVIFIPFQPLDRLAESLSMADVSLMGIYPKNEGVIMPSKLYSLLAIGKPIICVSDPKSEVADILEQAGAGIQSSVNDPKELAKNILTIVDDQEKAIEMGQNGRKYFLEHFERKIITKQWNEVLNKLS